MNILADSPQLLIPDHCNIVFYKAPHQRAQLSGVSPQSCPSMSLLSALTLRLHVPFIIFLSNQLI